MAKAADKEDKALGSGAKDKYDTPEEQAAADLLDGVTPPPASATANSGTTSANADTDDKGDKA